MYYRESPCALFGYSLILDVRKLIISHVRWDTCMIIPINDLNNLQSVSISEVRNCHSLYMLTEGAKDTQRRTSCAASSEMTPTGTKMTPTRKNTETTCITQAKTSVSCTSTRTVILYKLEALCLPILE